MMKQTLMSKRKTYYNILQLLKDGEFHSGESLGAQLNITRSAVWKAIQQLISLYQLNIQSISGRGYRIEGGLSLLDQDDILQHLPPTQHSQIHMTLLDQIDSTNDYLLQIMRNPNQHDLPFSIAVAEQQTQGRGRLGRTWHSPYGHNIYYSFGYRFHKDGLELSGLSLATGIAILRTLTQLGIKNLGIKWPNDIYYQEKKLAGILIDLAGESHGQTNAVMGIGINTYLSHKTALLINQPVISLHDILGHFIDRNQLIALLTQEMIIMIQQFDHSGLSQFIEEWNQYDCFKDKTVILYNTKQSVTGIMRGISPQGELMLEDEHQRITNYMSGELSLRITA